jgi:hypothetical protein
MRQYLTVGQPLEEESIRSRLLPRYFSASTFSPTEQFPSLYQESSISMTSPQTSDPKIDDDQPNMEIDWPSDAEFSFILDDSCSETRQQSLEEPLPEIRPTAEETQKTPAENLQPTRNAPPRLVDDNASTPNPVGSNVSPPSEPLLQISPGTDAMGTECGSKPLLKPEQEREV